MIALQHVERMNPVELLDRPSEPSEVAMAADNSEYGLNVVPACLGLA
jgi:hypothetical protein